MSIWSDGDGDGDDDDGGDLLARGGDLLAGRGDFLHTATTVGRMQDYREVGVVTFSPEGVIFAYWY